MKDKMNIPGTVFPTLNYGDVEILQYFNSSKVKIKFLNTGFITTALASNIRRGKVRDASTNIGVKIGTLYDIPKYGKAEVIEYNGPRNIKIKFINTGYETITTSAHISTGRIKDRLAPTVHGVGVIGSKYPSKVNGIPVKEYSLWATMLQRCYDSKEHNRHPTYKDCTVSENFKSYEYFYEWCQEQVGFGNDGWQLDKDLLVKGNKVYSEDTCVFLPNEINSAILNCKGSRGELPIGVSLYKQDRYKAMGHLNGKNVFLGIYSTPELAFKAYKEKKELSLVKLGMKWSQKIDPRAELALYNYKVEPDD